MVSQVQINSDSARDPPPPQVATTTVPGQSTPVRVTSPRDHSEAETVISIVATITPEQRKSLKQLSRPEAELHNNTELYQAISAKEWENTIKITRENPNYAANWAYRVKIEKWRRLPIIEAVVNKCPLEVLEVLLDAYPLGARAFDHANRVALHHACYHGCDEKIIRKLLVCFPEGLEKKDVWNKSPMTLADFSTSFSSSEMKEEVMKTLKEGPIAAIIKEHQGKWEAEQEKEVEKIKEKHKENIAVFEEKIKAVKEEMRDQWFKQDAHEKEIEKKLRDEMQKQREDEAEKRKKMQADHEQEIEHLKEIHANDLKEQAEATAELKEEGQAITNSKLVLEECIEEQKRTISKLERDLVDADAAKQRLREEITQNEATIADLEGQVKRLEREASSIQRDTSKFEHAVHIEKAKVIALQERLEANNKGFKAMELKVDVLKKKLEAAIEDGKGAKSEVKNLRSMTESLKSENRAQVKYCEDVVEKLDSVKATALELSEQDAATISELEQKLEAAAEKMKERDNAHVKEKDALVRKILALTEAVNSLRATFEQDHTVSISN